MEFNLSSETNLKPVVADVIKEFKAAGHFDRLRKECFAEIVSQTSFQNLNNNIESFVKKFLNDQERLGTSLKKNDIREMLKRKLYENYSFNNEISVMINQSIDSKKECSLKPIIDSLVETIIKQNEPEPEIRPQLETSSFIPEHIAFIPIQEPKPTPPPPKPAPPPPPQLQPLQQKVSVEDFLSIESKSTPQLKSRKVSESEKSTTKPIPKQIEKEDVKKDEKSTKTTSKPQISKSTKIKKPNKPTPKETDSLTRKITVETTLEIDPTHEYNFDWKLDQYDSKVFDDISVSSVNTSDLSDFSQYINDSD